jgi:nucleoside-diphosphate-sugar epimerase
LNAPKNLVHCEAFNVGRTQENYQIRDLADIVNETVPKCKIEYAKDGGPDKRCYRVDFNKIARILPAFKPLWTARKGAVELYEAVERVGLRLEDFEGPRYMRISHIQELISKGCLDTDLRWREKVDA